MKIYQVLEPRADYEGGPEEYGYYSTPEKAAARVEAVWNWKKYPKVGVETREFGGLKARTKWDFYEIRVQELELDKDLD